ncbi:hypothetical protein GWO13_06375 [Candidatus Bathyarchaeota archaeon]|nr:hypothetical protein [Candidatus Bathyarchaeota archaeon]
MNWGMPEAPEIELADVVRLAEISANTGVQYVRPDEVRKILIKMGIELTEPEDEQQPTTGEATESKGPEVVFEVRRRIERAKRRP